jgi:signal transduction histidine kinase
MNTLRVKIALLLVVAIVTVVGLLTAVLFYLLGPPQRLHSLAPVAQQIEMLVRVVDEGSQVIAIVPKPAPGRRQQRLTERLRDSLAARGLDLAVTVSRDGWRAPLVVSIPVRRQGWVLMPIADTPPQGAPWRGLVRWLILIRAEFVEDHEERARWLTDLDELERIADSAILLVREESGKAPPELIQLDELVGSIGAELRDQKLDVTETTLDPVKVRASRLTLNRALRNLIINAATHGVRARVEVGGLNGAARIVIEDDGPGLPPDMLDQVFEPFFRADPARRQDMRGAGLGLTIAREIIQRAGGSISIANRDGGGLRQVVELPQAA